MNTTINYKRIADFLHSEERKAMDNNDNARFELVHKKLNRLFYAWGKATKDYPRIKDIKVPVVTLRRR